MRPPPPEPWLCRTKLQAAAYTGHTSAVEKLLGSGVAVNEADERGKTALMFASFNGHLGAVRVLLKHGADVHRMNRVRPATALLYATERAHVAVVDALLRAGAHTHVTNHKSDFALAMACRAGNIEIVEKLIAAGANVNQHIDNRDLEWHGQTPLMYASRYRLTDIVEMLLSKGATVDAVDEMNYTSLIHACESSAVDAAAMLLEAGANVRHEGYEGDTALLVALRYVYRGRLDIFRVLLAAGAGVDGEVASRRLMEYEYPQVVAYLLDAGAIEDLGRALFSAVRSGHALVAKQLIAAGADVNHHDREGKTPLHEAVKYRHVEIVRILLDAFADADAASYDGTTPLMLAEQSSCKACKDAAALIRTCGRKQSSCGLQ